MDTRLQERLRQQSEQALSGSGTSDVYTNEHQLEESITPQSTRVQSLRRSIAESRLNRFQDNAATARVTMCDSSDWTKWRSQLSINLRIIGIRKVDELTTYDELANIAVRFFIDSTISEDICLATEHIEDTVELFNYLENTYGPEQRSNISEYARAYHALKWKQGEQVQALLSRTESVWSSYSTHVTPLTHNAKLAQLLAIVEEKNQFVYANLVNSLNTTWSGLSEEKILAELKTLLVNLTRDRRRPQAVRTHSDDSFETPTPTPLEYTASSTVTPVDNTAPTAAKVCSTCNRAGHTASQCKKCDHCNRFGHVEQYCRFKNKPATMVVEEIKADDTDTPAPTARIITGVDHVSYHISGLVWDDEIKSNDRFSNHHVKTTTADTKLDKWVFDTRSDAHVVGDKSLFTPGSLSARKGHVTTDNGRVDVIGAGEVTILLQKKDKTYHEITLQDVLYCPSSDVNIISGLQFARKGGDFNRREMLGRNGEHIAKFEIDKNELSLNTLRREQAEGSKAVYQTRTSFPKHGGRPKGARGL